MLRAGAPTLFSEEAINKIEDYLAPFRAHAENPESDSAPRGIPSLAGISVHLGVAKSTVCGWKKMTPLPGCESRTEENIEQFLNAMASLDALQEVYTLHRGLVGDYNPAISKVVLSRHGYADRVDSVSSDGSMTPAKNFNDFYVELGEGGDGG